MCFPKVYSQSFRKLVLYKDNESLEGGVDILCNSKYSEEEDIYHFEMANKYVKKGEKPK